MKAVFLTTLFSIVLLSSKTSIAGKIEIDRVWAEHNYGYALVSYTNDSNQTFKRYVTIKCTALDPDGKKININTRSLFTYEHGDIIPGFEGTVKVPIKIDNAELESISCGFIEN